jgi:hypothetical protein
MLHGLGQLRIVFVERIGKVPGLLRNLRLFQPGGIWSIATFEVQNIFDRRKFHHPAGQRLKMPISNLIDFLMSVKKYFVHVLI